MRKKAVVKLDDGLVYNRGGLFWQEQSRYRDPGNF